MRPNAFIFLIYILAFLLLFTSCIITDQPEEPAAEGPASGQVSKDKQSGQGVASEVEETSPQNHDETVEGPSDDLSGIIRVSAPSPGQIISSPLEIKGEARGTWFFEATFPIKLLDSEGNIIVEYYAQTEEEWMTEDFVSFTAQLEFDSPGTDIGVLLLIKNNPSDIREYDAQIEIPVRFR